MYSSSIQLWQEASKVNKCVQEFQIEPGKDKFEGWVKAEQKRVAEMCNCLVQELDDCLKVHHTLSDEMLASVVQARLTLEFHSKVKECLFDKSSKEGKGGKRYINKVVANKSSKAKVPEFFLGAFQCLHTSFTEEAMDRAARRFIRLEILVRSKAVFTFLEKFKQAGTSKDHDFTLFANTVNLSTLVSALSTASRTILKIQNYPERN